MKRSKQDRELTDEERNVVVAVRHCAGELNDILQGARRKAQSNTKVFAQCGVSVLFRGIESYADMYEKLAVKSREGVERLFSKFSDCEEVQDAQDAIEETEGNWRNFLKNLDKEMTLSQCEGQDGTTVTEPHVTKPVKRNYFVTAEYPLIDMHSNREITLGDYVSQNTCVFVTFQPAYWPDICVRWRHSEILKVMADLTQFHVGFVVVTWGPPDIVRTWAKQLFRAIKWPILWDKSGALCSRFGFRIGLERVWSAENLDFLGCQRAMHGRSAKPPPTDFDWLKWRQIGGEAVIARPVCWDAGVTRESAPNTEMSRSVTQKRSHARDMDESGSDADENHAEEEETHDVELQARLDKEAVNAGETKICLIHQSSHLADFAPSGSIYQAALTCHARAQNITEALVLDRIRQNRRFSTAPESARLQYETTTGLYYDPETQLYYDASRGYFYDSITSMYYYWSQSEHRYIPANTLIQAEIAAAHTAQAVAAQAAATRALTEREAARQAAMRVAAELAEIRAAKDDYAAYVYATCVAPQQEMSQTEAPRVKNTYRSTTAAANNIAMSLKAWDVRQPEPLVPYTDDVFESVHPQDSSLPTPPGL